MSIYIPSSNTDGITVSQLLSYGYVNQNTLNNNLSTKANLSGNTSFQSATGSFANLIGGTGSFTNLTLTNAISSPYLRGSSAVFFNGTTSQSVPNGTVVIVNNLAQQSNNMGSDLTVSNSNSRFTYNGAATRVWIVSYSIGFQNGSTSGTPIVNPFIQRSDGNRYGQIYAPTGMRAYNVQGTTTVVPMSTGQYIEFIFYQESSNTVTINLNPFPSVFTIIE